MVYGELSWSSRFPETRAHRSDFGISWLPDVPPSPAYAMSKPSITELPSLEALKKDAIALGQEAAEMARDRVLRPAQELVRDSRHQMDAAGERLKGEAADAEAALKVQRDRAADWIAAHPFAAVGLALGAGVLLSELLRDRR